MDAKPAPRVVVENDSRGIVTGAEGRRATLLVSNPSHLCSVQWTTREICRSLGYDEAGVYHAVIAVTELAHREIILLGRDGRLELSAIRVRGRLALEAAVETAACEPCA